MPDSRKSKVPYFTFAATLEAQHAELAGNELVQRFARSRGEFASDRYRPRYHFVSPESTLNDPNGLCFWQDKWHLFYQGYPPEDPRQHWGHAVSDDLIHWKDLPYAIYPDPEECVFSGATLVEENRVLAMYHGTKSGNYVAISKDPLLLNWEKLTGDAVIKPGDHPDLPRIFDPCIWKQGDTYYSLSGGTEPNTYGPRQHRADFLLRSTDLVKWEYLHNLIDGDYWGQVGDDGACPYFWPIGDKHILLHFSHMSGAHWLIGDYDTDKQKLCATNGGDFTFSPVGGGGIHAPSAAPSPDGGGDVICIFNINAGYPTKGWDHIMSLPRKLSLYGGDQLAQEPAGDIDSLHGDKTTTEPLDLELNKEIVLDKISGNCLELDIEIDLMGAKLIEINLLRSPGKQEYTRIAFQRGRRYPSANSKSGFARRNSMLILDNAHSSEAPQATIRMPECGPLAFGDDETLKLRIFIDMSMVEVFANGKQCVAGRVYPARDDSTGVSIQARGGDAKLLKLDAYRMKSIY